MSITLNDVTPVGLCIATQELFDAKRYQQNFCDHVLLRMKDAEMERFIMPMKRDLNSLIYQKKFLDGHKAAIISNIDKILSLVTSRYANVSLSLVGAIINDGRELMKKVLFAENFEKISELEGIFRSKITFPVYKLFSDSLKKQNVI